MFQFCANPRIRISPLTYTIDPDGEIIIILRNINALFALLARNLSTNKVLYYIRELLNSTIAKK